MAGGRKGTGLADFADAVFVEILDVDRVFQFLFVIGHRPVSLDQGPGFGVKEVFVVRNQADDRGVQLLADQVGAAGAGGRDQAV